MVNIPSYVVRLDSQKHIDFSLKSPYGGGRPGKPTFMTGADGSEMSLELFESDEFLTCNKSISLCRTC